MEALFKGIGVGLAVAAPVGPIGLLCINRTLNRGRLAGLASGFGAATADAFYGIVAALGLAGTGLLTRYAGLFELAGGMLIAILGILSIKKFLFKKINESPYPPLGKGASMLGSFMTTFVLTISNPMTIIAFMGFIAALGAPERDNPAAPFHVVYGVFLGSALWWLFLVQTTHSAKTRLPAGTTSWLDLISGTVLFGWGIWILLGLV